MFDGFSTDGDAATPVSVFILTYERPLYLWACLDSLFRNTKYPARFIVSDNASKDPLIRQVIRGFERRRMFHAIHLCPENSPDRLKWMLELHRHELGEFFAFVEGDVVVCDSEEGWLNTMVRHMREDPQLWMLGSRIDQRDFVDPQFARTVDPVLSATERDFLIKAHSPERLPLDVAARLIEPYNPPGRLLMLRTEMLRQVAIRTDAETYNDVRRLGFKARIAADVVHRHLSLLNFFDYPGYDSTNRTDWVDQLRNSTRLVEI